jgi:hypothetical protein
MGQKNLHCSVKKAGCLTTAEHVCHHCGRLICRGSGCCKWSWDSDFAGRKGLFALSPVAYHCPNCDHAGPLTQIFRRIKFLG